MKLDYGKHGARVSVIERLRGMSGWLTLARLEVTAFETTEALTTAGRNRIVKSLERGVSSGKITELAVRDVVHGRPVKNTEALANPEALEQYRDRMELKS